MQALQVSLAQHVLKIAGNSVPSLVTSTAVGPGGFEGAEPSLAHAALKHSMALGPSVSGQMTSQEGNLVIIIDYQSIHHLRSPVDVAHGNDPTHAPQTSDAYISKVPFDDLSVVQNTNFASRK